MDLAVSQINHFFLVVKHPKFHIVILNKYICWSQLKNENSPKFQSNLSNPNSWGQLLWFHLMSNCLSILSKRLRIHQYPGDGTCPADRNTDPRLGGDSFDWWMVADVNVASKKKTPLVTSSLVR